MLSPNRMRVGTPLKKERGNDSSQQVVNKRGFAYEMENNNSSSGLGVNT